MYNATTDVDWVDQARTVCLSMLTTFREALEEDDDGEAMIAKLSHAYTLATVLMGILE